ncbi:hypothetical protein [Streptomyces phaeochromogenes]|uniref:hypothetical protein n=1 Tax=Streptomyces phaeochromogenes TaxID=1923 RepID=UPI0036B1D4E7
MFADFFRRVGFRPGEDEGALVAYQVAMAIASRDAVAAEEIRRRFGQAAVPYINGANPASVGDDGDV